MRYINNQQLRAKLPADWQAKVERKLNEIREMTPEERSKAIDNARGIWAELKNILAELSHGKCWYCETQIVRNDMEVDHYRPKKAIWGYPNHHGYWWLAFDWRNYRLSCTFCNQIRNVEATESDRQTIKTGKGTQFPLLDETKRVFEECNTAALTQEYPVLLDPTLAADPKLLTFDPDGMARPAKQQQQFPFEYRKARDSIIIYHLNRPEIKERRQKDICNRVEQLVEQGDIYYDLWRESNETNMVAWKGYNDVLQKLEDMLHERSEYSSAAKAALKAYRNREKHPWVEELLDAS